MPPFWGRIATGSSGWKANLDAQTRIGSPTLADGTLARFLDRATRLYEQQRQMPKALLALGAYVKRWCAWAGAGLATTGSGFTPPLVGPGRFGERAGPPGAPRGIDR